FYAYLVPTFLIKQFNLELKYTRIDPDYIAPASGVTDTSYRTQPTSTTVKQHSVTTLSDPTTDYNNMNRVEASARIMLPNGLLRINYGASPQLRPSMDSFYTRHAAIGSDVWWKGFYSGYGFPYTADPQRADMAYYNINRYGLNNWDESANYIISAGTGGLTTDLWNGHREFMSTGTHTETIKTINTAVFDLRYEINKLPLITSLVRRSLFMHIYGELTNLSAGTNFLVSFDNSRIFTQGILTSTLVYNAFDGMNLLGYWAMEKWLSKQVVPYEMDYYENVFGLGADFDIAPRTGLFIRVKNFYHDDKQVRANNFHGWLINAEIKSFF
ncbi:MAG: hypothetical protein LLG37_10030, partial [Spirochaetia bacterium]|nr:hypothetical protein [Spirochaetia bacterium]